MPIQLSWREIGLDWLCLLAGRSKQPPGFEKKNPWYDFSSYFLLKFIEIKTLAFFKHNNSSVATVTLCHCDNDPTFCCIISNPRQICSFLNFTYPLIANYYVTFIILRFIHLGLKLDICTLSYLISDKNCVRKYLLQD